MVGMLFQERCLSRHAVRDLKYGNRCLLRRRAGEHTGRSCACPASRGSSARSAHQEACSCEAHTILHILQVRPHPDPLSQQIPSKQTLSHTLPSAKPLRRALHLPLQLIHHDCDAPPNPARPSKWFSSDQPEEGGRRRGATAFCPVRQDPLSHFLQAP